MFLDRSASFLLRVESLTAAIVILVMGMRVNLVALERAVVQRVGRVADLLEIALVEGVLVDDQEAAGDQVLQVRL